MGETWRALQDLVFSSRCLVCGEPATDFGLDICTPCRSAWQVPAVAVASRPDIFAVHPYDRVAQRIILAVKEHGRHALEPVLAQSIAIACLPLLVRSRAPVLLVPAPSRASARRRRGADVVWSVAQRSATLLAEAGWEVIPRRLLTHARKVDDQSGLGAYERERNIAGSMRLRSASISPTSLTTRWDRPIMEGEIIVVDDLVTTGATMREAIRVLGEVGIVLGGAAAAGTNVRQRRHIDPSPIDTGHIDRR